MVDVRTGGSEKRRLSPLEAKAVGSWRALNEHTGDATHLCFLIDFEQLSETLELRSFILVSSFIELAMDLHILEIQEGEIFRIIFILHL